MSKIETVERALWAGVQQQEDNEVLIEEGIVRMTTPSAPVSFKNGVFRFEVDEAEASKKVAEFVEHFRARKLPFRWKVTSSSRPRQLPELLEAEKLELRDIQWGLWADPAQLSIPVDQKTRVEALTEKNLEDWLKVQMDAWKLPLPGIQYLRNKMIQELKKPSLPESHYLAFYNGQPAGSAAMYLFSDSALFSGAAVKQEFRGLGVYRALIAYRLKKLRELSVPAIIHCLERTSGPICVKLGFEKVCEIHSYEPKV